jgi:hypothetical protein
MGGETYATGRRELESEALGVGELELAMSKDVFGSCRDGESVYCDEESMESISHQQT